MLVWDSIITIINLILIGLYIIVMILATRALLKYIRSKNTSRDTSVVQKSLGEILKAHRTRCNMTQEHIAEALGVSRQAVSKWEIGASVPSTANLLALAELYDISVDDLLKGTDREHPL